MNLLSSLEKFGLDGMDTDNLFEEPSAHPAGKEKQSAAEEEKTPEMIEAGFLLSKSIRCPVCDKVFRTRMVKSGRIKRLEPDADLRPRFQFIDTNKYDVSVCPNCGYASLTRFFPHISTAQIKMIEEGVCKKFKSQEVTKDDENAVYTYSYAIERYKLALYNTIVKKGKNSEKAYVCLKISWLYRGWIEELAKDKEKNKQQIVECKQEEAVYYSKAYEGFTKALATELFPMCGMEESTVNLLIANMAYRLNKVDVASKMIAMILTSQAASRSVKDRAMNLKEQIVSKLHSNS